MKTALRMNDSHFAMSIYEEAGDVYFKGHRKQLASLPFYRVRGCKWQETKHVYFHADLIYQEFTCASRTAACHSREASRMFIQSSVCWVN